MFFPKYTINSSANPRSGGFLLFYIIFGAFFSTGMVNLTKQHKKRGLFSPLFQ